MQKLKKEITKTKERKKEHIHQNPLLKLYGVLTQMILEIRTDCKNELSTLLIVYLLAVLLMHSESLRLKKMNISKKSHRMASDKW
jgi:uncharacterized membrane protein